MKTLGVDVRQRRLQRHLQGLSRSMGLALTAGPKDTGQETAPFALKAWKSFDGQASLLREESKEEEVKGIFKVLAAKAGAKARTKTLGSPRAGAKASGGERQTSRLRSRQSRKTTLAQ